MKLLTKAIEKKLPRLYSTLNDTIKKVHIHFFSPYMNMDWYVFEGERITDGDMTFFGRIDGLYPEYGYFLLSELESQTRFNGKLKLIERDLYFDKNTKYNTETNKLC
jgi:hypothetical protein